MIILLSPAKSLDFEHDPYPVTSLPRFQNDSLELVKLMKKKTAADLKQLMSLSTGLAKLNESRFQIFDTDFNTEKARPAIFAFKGDVYIGLDVDSLNDEDLKFAQEHVRILSGLYGLLRPLDLIQPYRLEMGTVLKNERGSNLYEFWGDNLTSLITKDLKDLNSNVLINLASNEYYKAVHPDQIKASIYTIHFREYRNGELKFVSFNAKKARGYMTNYIVRNKLVSPEEIKNFDDHEYIYHEDLSKEYEWYFTRQ